MFKPKSDPNAPVVTHLWRVPCDGPAGGKTHPRTWLILPRPTGEAQCPYCRRRFVHETFSRT